MTQKTSGDLEDDEEEEIALGNRKQRKGRLFPGNSVFLFSDCFGCSGNNTERRYVSI